MRLVVQLTATLTLAAGLVLATDKDVPILPDIWKAVENSYDSDVLVTFPDLGVGTSILVDEVYDITDAKGMLNILDGGRTSKTNYYTSTQQTFVVQDSKCTVGTLRYHEGYDIWGWIGNATDGDGDEKFLYGPSALLRIVKEYNKSVEYVNQEPIRGINADHWVIHHTYNYTIDYYFASDQWLMPYGHTMDGVNLKAPLKVVVHGMQGDPWNSQAPPKVQDVVYDYTDFKPYVSDKRKHVFLVDNGLDCAGRRTMDKNKTDPPEVPDTFEVFMEVVKKPLDGSSDEVFRSWMYYDKWRQMVRLDINPDMDADQHTQTYKSVHDYNTGIEYRIFQETGQCNMQALDPNQLGSMIGSSVMGSIIRADPDNFFYLDKLYVFTGYGETRSVLTNRWTATRDDILDPGTGDNFKKVVVDYMFLTDNTTDDSGLIGLNVPVRIDATVYNNSDLDSPLYTHTLNLLHFVTNFEVYQLNPFDVRDCMDIPSQRTWFKITFSGDWSHGAMQEPDIFRKVLLDRISSGSGSTYARFPEIDLDHDDDYVYATMLVLEPAPYIIEFQKLEDRKPTINDVQLSLTIQDLDLCALQCLQYLPFACRSFYQCKGLGRNCFLSNYKISPGDFVDIPKNCSHYNRAVIKHTRIQKNNADLMTWIKSQIDQNRFKLKVVYHDNNGHAKNGWYTGTAAEVELAPDDPILLDLIRADFHEAYVKGKLRGHIDQQFNKVSYDVCVANCDKEKAFKCETFSYCYNDRSCYLSSYVVDTPVPDKSVIMKSDCVIISRSHTDDYSKLDGTVYLGTPKAQKVTIDPDKCAFYCDNSTTFTCRSFDYCADEGSCNLFDEHSVDVPDNLLNHSYPDCVHYTRNALVDFVKHPNQVLAGNRDRYVNEVSTTECAQVCENEPDFGCDGFDYCVESGDITCFLTSAHYSDAGVVITNSPTCDHYSREYYEGDDRDSHANKKKSGKYIYGSGDMAGLACSMLVISIGLTFAGVYWYNKYYKG